MYKYNIAQVPKSSSVVASVEMKTIYGELLPLHANRLDGFRTDLTERVECVKF